MKDAQKKSPVPAATGSEAKGSASSEYYSSRCPSFPASAHCRAALGCLLAGGKVDQFTYHTATGCPLVDFRTRVSELSRDYHWPIADEFHDTRDFNGEPRRVKRYWLDHAEMLALFDRCPSLKRRCELFLAHFERGV